MRNALLGAPVSDFDLATTLEPEAVFKALKAANIAVHETGVEHGTLTAIADKTVFEITTLRRDVSTDGRRARVAFSQDWSEDARRRDFTMNTLYCDLDGTLYDPTRQGLSDLKARKLRFVGTAKNRIEEDYLRILRYFRFHACYMPKAVMDKEALAACRDLQAGLKTLSAERVWSEIKKLLAARAPFRTVNIMGIHGILESLLPEASNSEGLQLLCALEAKMQLAPDPYLRLMALSARDAFAMAGLCRRLKMSNKEKARLIRWASDQSALRLGLSDKDLKIAIYSSGRQSAMDRALIRAAGARDPILAAQWRGIYDVAYNWDWPHFPITGKDLIAAGLSSGPQIGKTMKALKALWVRSGFQANKQALLSALALMKRI